MRTEIFLVRHGQVDAAWRERIYGCLDVPLSDHGRSEARRAAAFLAKQPFEAVLSSGLSRTRYGAEWIARGRGLQVQPDAALRELDRGAWAGLSFAELDAQEPGAFENWKAHAWTCGPPGGESMADLGKRVWPVLDELAEQNHGKQVVVVAHMHVLKAALAKVLGEQAAMDHEIPTGSILALDWTADGPVSLSSLETFDQG